MKAAYERFGESLVQFDEAHFVDSRSNQLQLGGQWREHQATFQGLVGRSAYKASASAALLQLYNKPVMADVDWSADVDGSAVPNLKRQLHSFMKTLNATSEDIIGMANEFHSLGYDIQDFGNSSKRVYAKRTSALKDKMANPQRSSLPWRITRAHLTRTGRISNIFPRF
ncbi:hypothetical protein PYCCODRAFT_1429831 [Trametes coccinea BRFM310]|uniref:Uncharacterized protein n=1 Tax=Trametes coccinea (strain BRFM310) TaxID=1353009 RepID=A0A1Y2J787_TRAC3|nr:hypothetical protein PYCCODRAFT_1429831 [Trametes coccinea BRFM310]